MEITHIKENLNISTVLAHYGLKWDKNSRLPCPFHEDTNPSMQVYRKTNTVYCFSSNCKLHGKAIDTIDFIMYKENLSKHEALKKATSLIPVLTITPIKTMKTEPANEKSLNEIFQQLQQNINKSPQAKEYLESRNLDSTKLEIGYNASYYKDLKHCIVFGLRDINNTITSLYGRSIYNNTDQKHYYQANRKGIYPNYPKENTTKIIITESIIDAASLLKIQSINENYSIISAFGTNGLNEEIKNSITTLNNLQEIIFAFDSDDAGNAAVIKYTEELKQALPNITLSKIMLPCKDVNETLQAHNEEIFMHLLNERQFLFSNEKEKVQHLQSPTNTELSNLPTLNFPTKKLNTKNPEQVSYNTDELLITLLGGISLQNLDRLRVTIYLRRNPHINAQQSIRQNIDLYQDDIVEKFIRKSAEKLDHSTTLISGVIAQMTEEIEAWRLLQIENKKVTKVAKKEMTQAEKETALINLQRENLMQWTMEMLLDTGIVGEAENAMILNVAMTSRLYEDPVSVICLSQSGTGKSYLLERVARCFPAEDIIENTQFTDNSFFYWKDGLKGKAIIIEDMEGAQNVEYHIRELITKKYITKTTVHKDAKGNMQTVQYRVEGPATFLGCTTKEKIYEDNANRCILIYLDNSKAQDKNVMDYHKQNRAGIIDRSTEHAKRELLKNMQSMLQTKKVINPYATLIDLPESVLKPRRSIGILLSFIEVITLYHQYQCTIKDGCLETHPTHIEWGFRLLKESLFRKSDELSAAQRGFLDILKSILTKQKKQSFYAKEIRPELNIYPRTLRKYLYELNDFGYIKITGGDKYRKGHEYELTELGKDNRLKSSIDKHIEEVLKKVWASFHEKQANKKSKE